MRTWLLTLKKKTGLAALALLAVMAAGPADAGPVLERVKARGTVHCGSVERPGLAEVDGNGAWRGVEVDICHAVAAAVLGHAEKITFDGYESPNDFDRVRKNADDLFFLTGGEMATEKLTAAVLPGPTVFIASDAVMVPGDSPVQHLADLAGKGICFMIGDSSEHSLEQYFESANLNWLRHPYSEPGEMDDAYAVQRCHAVAGETTELARTRLLSGPRRLRSRVLPEAINVFPIMAATGRQDAQWSAIVAWTVHTLLAAQRPERTWFAGGSRAMPVAAVELGLTPGWQDRVLQSTGHFGDIFTRNLGSGSPYRLEPAMNANALQGGMLFAPFVE